MSAARLTKPQQALLAEMRAKGGTVTKNGRIARTAHALRDAGLITLDWWPVPNSMGVPTEHWELTLVEDA